VDGNLSSLLLSQPKVAASLPLTIESGFTNLPMAKGIVARRAQQVFATETYEFIRSQL
jgi:hypothetical protein